ncbi:MAG: hypothetical protein IT336_00055, partial [Thermomicrobiales bacterium]|nr:hypothetical protein [Thermomicrobiales bacterium]
MKRSIIGLLALSLLASLAFAPAWAGASNHGDMGGHGWREEGLPITAAEAGDRATAFLADMGLTTLRIGDVVAFESGFYVPVLDQASGAGAFELLVTLAGSSVHLAPGPSMMWNTEYSPMFGAQGTELHDRLMTAMQHDGMTMGGMHGGGDMMNGAMHGDAAASGDWKGHMGGLSDPGQALAIPLTTDDAVERAQTRLDQDVPGATAVRPVAFPGYVTVLIEEEGQVTGFLSIQTTTGAIW